MAMANSGPNTNGSQFFIITGAQGVGLPPSYWLFGQVTEGLDTTVADLAATGSASGTPTEPVQIQSVPHRPVLTTPPAEGGVSE